MKVNQIIINEMTSGCVATVSKPLGEIQKRPDVKGLSPVGSKSKKKGPYANSLLEGKVKELQMDLSSGRDGLSDADFKKKYGKSKEEMRKLLNGKTKTEKPVQEAKLDEDDLILVPGQKMKRRTGFVPHGQSRVDHEVSMARSDVLATIKNAKSIYKILSNKTEEEGLEGWVQEKLIKANDYLNSVKEYYDEKMMREMTGGVIAAGGVGEGVAEGKSLPSMSDIDQQFSDLERKINDLESQGEVVGKDHPLSKKWQQLVAMKQRAIKRKTKQGVAEGSDDNDEYSDEAIARWKKQQEFEREYNKKKPVKPDDKNKGK
jgi:hypothetical protein